MRSAWIAILVAGCGGAPSQPVDCSEPTPIALVIEATERLNPDPDGRALPTELRLYQLRDAAGAETASFEDLWERAPAVLGDALVSEESLTLYPGERLERALAPDPQTTTILAVAIVRAPAGRTWRALVPMSRSSTSSETCPRLQPGQLFLRLDDHRIEAITPRPPETRG